MLAELDKTVTDIGKANFEEAGRSLPEGQKENLNAKLCRTIADKGTVAKAEEELAGQLGGQQRELLNQLDETALGALRSLMDAITSSGAQPALGDDTLRKMRSMAWGKTSVHVILQARDNLDGDDLSAISAISKIEYKYIKALESFQQALKMGACPAR
jgi:hypothetical protein